MANSISRINFKISSPKINSLKLPSVQQQLAIVSNPILRQLYQAQRNVSSGQRVGKSLSSNKSSLFK